jgi:hypothetical protein
MGAPAIFEKQIEIKLLHPASTEGSRIQVYFNQIVEITEVRARGILQSR